MIELSVDAVKIIGFKRLGAFRRAAQDINRHRNHFDPETKLYRVYMLRCNDGSFYCGMTSDVYKRLQKHRNKKGAKYLRSRLPVTLVAVTDLMQRETALSLEAAVKKLPSKRKVPAINLLRIEEFDFDAHNQT